MKFDKEKRVYSPGTIIALSALIAFIVSLTVLFVYISFVGIKKDVVSQGDIVYISYVMRDENNSVIDHGNSSFVVGRGDVIKGIDDAVLGMKIGDTKTITLNPELAYGNYSSNKVINFTNAEFFEQFDVLLNIEFNDTVENFTKMFGEEPIVNKTYEGQLWNITVIKVEDGNVFLRHEPENGLLISLPYYSGNYIVILENDKIRLRPIPIEGQTMFTAIGAARIAEVGRNYITLDFNHPFAGRTLIFNIKILNITKQGL